VPFRPARSVTLAAALASLSCGESSGPASRLLVDLTPAIGSMYVNPGPPDGWPEASCTVSIRAVATGGGNASWSSGTFRFFIGANRAAPVDSSPVAAAEIAEAFGEASVASGDTLFGGWSVYAGFPFEVEIRIAYTRADGGRDSVSTPRMACGPRPAGIAGPPAVSTPVITPAGQLQPGQQFSVSYTASGQQLWATEVIESGSWEFARVIDEQRQAAVQRTVHSHVPAEAQLGVPLDVEVWSWDAFARYGGAALSSGAIVDQAAPAAGVAVGSACCSQPVDTILRGYHYIGDTLVLNLSANDNHRLGKARWELLPDGPVDSILLSSRSWSETRRVPVTAEWASRTGHGVRLTVWDASGQSVQRLVVSDTSLRFVPTVNRPATSAALIGSISVARADAARNVVYVAQPNFQRVSVVNPATLAVASVFGFTNNPSGMDLTPSGDSLVVVIPTEKALAVIDLLAPTPTITKIPLTALAEDERPGLVAVAANGKAIVTVGVTGIYVSPKRPLEVVLATGAQRILNAGAAGQVTQHIEASPDRDIIVLSTDACTQVYFAVPDSLGECKVRPWGRPTISRAPHRIAIGRSIYDTNLDLVRAIPSLSGRVEAETPGVFQQSFLTSDAQLLFHMRFNGGLGRSRVSDGVILDRSPLGVLNGIVLPGDTSLFHWTGTTNAGIGVIDLRPSAATAVSVRAPVATSAPAAVQTPAAGPRRPDRSRMRGRVLVRPIVR
jgi:hypothetical protein